MRIGVYGSASGEIVDGVRLKAREIGIEIARRDHDLITGACTGLPYDAVNVVCERVGRKGRIIGYSPAISLGEHMDFNMPVEGFDELSFIDGKFSFLPKSARLKLRNVLSVYESDAAIFIAGRIGSMNEFTNAYDMGKNIGVLVETGGFADMAQGIVKTLGKETKSKIVYSKDPEELLDMIDDL